ncbi:MAG: TRAP transporter permease [Desulfarculaceae bacterium]|nr:TRAP transporter permease [Desulfarculaceae bacterium]MCF8070781.1 TRAP transporter permease [Desulfarculaceae bacterium]MCF8102218.1 TRAP transporter permease [Desulfarculaceae bacterium]MCF8116983.1 TRAP transporter permease [Desulfarculaceae bacterium]
MPPNPDEIRGLKAPKDGAPASDGPDEGLASAQAAAAADLGLRDPQGWQRGLIPVVAAAWSVFQLLLPWAILLETVYVRAVHLAFAMVLVYLCFPAIKKHDLKGRLGYFSRRERIGPLDLVLAGLAGLAALYIALDHQGLALRQGDPLTRDLVAGGVLVVLLLEAVRRSLGPALVLVAIAFMIYAFGGPHMPDAIAFKGVSLSRFMGQETMSTEGIYGIPLDVSASIVFLFVLFGAMMDRAGGGRYFVRLAFSLLGSFKGGPAKAAVLASGLTGLVSGSSIANVVTTGTFTIPLMKSAGYPAKKAAAIEVAASTDGQLMPPIMGAAAFIIAEYCNLEYMAVVKAAILPALLSYLTLFFITHLEAGKLGLTSLPRNQLPPFWATLRSGFHFLAPLAVLIYELMVLRHSPALAVFRAIVVLAGLIVAQSLWRALREGEGWGAGLREAGAILWQSLVAGGRNMMGIGVAVAGAGLIVGVVNMGLGGLITEIVELMAGDSLYLLLALTALACLLMGMGLPTTATYIVMASLMAVVIVELGPSAGLVVPLIAAHLFVFYFGILADDTPPVGLAAYAASAIARSNPIPTGLQSFTYDLRTAILPFMFIFNTRLLLIGVDSWWMGLWVGLSGVAAMFAFAAATQGYLRQPNRWWEGLLLLAAAAVILQPGASARFLGLPGAEASQAVGTALFVLVWLGQKWRPRGRQAVA